MATAQSLRDRLRLELRDPPMTFEAATVGDGSFNRFDLPVDLVASGSLTVELNNVLMIENTDYTVDYLDGVISMTAVVPNDQALLVDGRHYSTFIDAELDTFIATAFGQHTNRELSVIGLPLAYADLAPIEDYLVVLLAKVEALWILATEVSRGFDIITPDGVSLPTGQTFQQLMALVAVTKTEYTDLSSKLGVGLDRIEMFTLRRVSKITRRLIPVYIAQEYDDIRLPYTPIAGPVGTIVVISGQHFTGVTAVKFNTTNAVTFTVVNDTTIQATVPVGATTGPLVITSPGGVITTGTVFTVGSLAPALNQGGPVRVYPPIDRLA